MAEDRENPYLPLEAEIVRVVNDTSDTKTYRVKLDDNPLPGVFYQLSVLAYGECPISVCSYSDKFVEFCIRNVGNVTKALHGLRKGDKMLLRGPYGHGYPMSEMQGKNIVIIAGGTGVAPVKGVIEYIKSHRDQFGDVKVYLGYRGYDEMLFRDSLDQWEKDFDLTITLDKPDKRWKGKVGMITNLVRSGKYDADTIFMVCGPPIMIKFVMQELAAQNISEKNIYVSFERLMQCGIGKCGHCMIGNKYCCKDGPVFRYDSAKLLED